MMEGRLFAPELFREEDDKPVLICGRCKKCGAMSFPKGQLCVECLSTDIETVDVSPTGQLYSYTITRRQVDNWKAPHAIGMVSIPEQKLRIVAPLVMEEGNEDFKVGEAMEMVITDYWTDDNGENVIGYKYRPVSQSGGDKDA